MATFPCASQTIILISLFYPVVIQVLLLPKGMLVVLFDWVIALVVLFDWVIALVVLFDWVIALVVLL